MSNIIHLQRACDQLTNPSLPERVTASSEKCCICKKLFAAFSLSIWAFPKDLAQGMLRMHKRGLGRYSGHSKRHRKPPTLVSHGSGQHEHGLLETAGPAIAGACKGSASRPRVLCLGGSRPRPCVVGH